MIAFETALNQSIYKEKKSMRYRLQHNTGVGSERQTAIHLKLTSLLCFTSTLPVYTIV